MRIHGAACSDFYMVMRVGAHPELQWRVARVLALERHLARPYAEGRHGRTWHERGERLLFGFCPPRSRLHPQPTRKESAEGENSVRRVGVFGGGALLTRARVPPPDTDPACSASAPTDLEMALPVHTGSAAAFERVDRSR